MEMQDRWENQLLALAGKIPHASTRPPFSYWAGDAKLQKTYNMLKLSPLNTANPSTSPPYFSPKRNALLSAPSTLSAEPWMISWMNRPTMSVSLNWITDAG